MTNNILTALATTYLHHNLPVPTLPPFRRVNRIAIQNDFPLAAWSCGTKAIPTTLHLTLGQIRPGKINIDIINRRHILTFHQTLLKWLIMGTPPNLWDLNCINCDIIQGEQRPMRIHAITSPLKREQHYPASPPNTQQSTTTRLRKPQSGSKACNISSPKSHLKENKQTNYYPTPQHPEPTQHRTHATAIRRTR